MFSEQKRFIAGAVCPRCAAMDKVVAYRKVDKDYRECVKCGFIDELLVGAGAPPPDTRISKSERRDAAVAEPVKFVGFSEGK